MDDFVHRFEDVGHEELLVGLLDAEVLRLLLCIVGAEVLLIIEAERVGVFGLSLPVLVDEILEEDRSLLANLALEVLVDLIKKCG